MTPRGLQAPPLQHIPLGYLDLSRWNVDAAQMSRLLEPMASTLEVLHVSQVPRGSLLVLPSMTALKQLHMAATHPRPEDLQALARALPGAVQAVDMQSNQLTKRHLERVPEGAFARLRSLTLADNPLGDEGAKRLARLLRDTRALRELRLGQTGLGDAGVEALAPACRLLELLHVQENQITSAGLRTLADAAMPRLRSLALVENPALMRGRGGAPLAQILRTSPELWMLDISATGVQDQDMTQELMDAFSRHTSVLVPSQ